NVHDGLGMFLLNKAGIKSVIITARLSRVVKRRASDMRVSAVYSNHDKLKMYKKVLKRFRVKDEEVCFMGDELLDLPVLKRAGLAVAPPNAVEEVKNIVHYVTRRYGGKGAVREIIEIILKSQGLWDKVITGYMR
ncbi:MAG TPA: 3-deoxy-D-manno-octulosonate 8-phosphate phosphatase, partial [Candidatus Omnitrophica bacterium]|nr:3-deoxy-D-manno-octulosonate 8-phosphate phosphatase [Candidatus Omnitrophota bacterium]